MSYYYAKTLISELGELYGFPLNIDITNRAICLLRNNNDKWYLETSESEEYLLIHHQVTTLNNLTHEHLIELMQLNANTSLMRGAWFGVHAKTNSCRMFKILQLNTLTAHLLCEELNGLVLLIRNISKCYNFLYQGK